MTHLINQDDITWAVGQDSWACAIVRCIQREIPNSKFVRANTEVIAYSVGGHRYTHSTPQVLVDKVIKPLDTGKSVKPIEFELGAATVTQVKHLTDEDRQKLRTIQRTRQAFEHKQKKERVSPRVHNRFCDPVTVSE